MAQAVSKYIAGATSEYQVWHGKRTATTFPPYDAAAIRKCLDDLKTEESQVARFFDAFGDHLLVRYEDLDAEPVSQLTNALAFLGLPTETACNASSDLTRQRNDASDAYRQRFQDEMA